jgi:polysaccharide export outer membrane protein
MRSLRLPFAALAAGVLLMPAAAVTGQQLNTGTVPGLGASAGSHNRPAATGQILPSATGRLFPKDGRLLLGQGDLIRIDLYDTPDFDQDARIGPDGEVSLLGLARPLKLEDLSLEEAARSIEHEYRSQQIILEPHATVSVVEYVSHGVALSGEFRSPGIYAILGERRLADLIAAAGGPTELSDGTVTIHRGYDDSVEQVTIAGQAQTTLVRPGDQVAMNRAHIIYVVGNVTRPGGFPLVRRTSMMQALALAEGLKPSTKSNSVLLYRQSPGSGARTVFEVRLKDILDGKAPDIALAADDILYIPPSPVKAVLARGAEAAIALASNAAIYYH